MTQGFYLARRPALYVPLWHVIGSDQAISLLSRRWVYVDGDGKIHRASPGMPTDGVSIPRTFWRVAGHPYGRWLPIAVIHDHYCYKALVVPPGPERNALRSSADRVFWDGCKYLRPDQPAVTWVLYRAVRTGSLATRFAATWPDYEHQPYEFYERLDLGHMSQAVIGRRHLE